MASWAFARTIREDDVAAPDIARFERTVAGFDVAWEALTWLLARKCDSVPFVSKTIGGVTYHLYAQAADELAETPTIVVLYTFDNNFVDILGVLATPYKREASS